MKAVKYLLAALCLALAPQALLAQAPTAPAMALVYEGRESYGAAEMRKIIDSLSLPVKVDVYADAPALGKEAEVDFSRYDLVFVDAAAQGVPLGGAEIEKLRAAARLVVVNPQGGVQGNVSPQQQADVQAYWDNRSNDNDAALVQYLAGAVLGVPGVAPAPRAVTYPDYQFYHPDAPGTFASLDEYLAWYAARKDGRAYDASAPTLGFLIHRSLLLRKSTAVWDALIREAEKKGANAIALAAPSDQDVRRFQRNGRTVIDALLFRGSLLHHDEDRGREQAAALGVPMLMVLDHHRLTTEEFLSGKGGMVPDLVYMMVGGERSGSLEPIAVAAKSSKDGPKEPIEMQVAWRIERALAWARLHRQANSEKKVVFTYWSEAGGKADAGGDPDDFLDVQGTLAKMLPLMRERGFNVGAGELPDAAALAKRMAQEATNMGSWSPGEIARRVQAGSAALVPEATYLGWYEQLPEKNRKEIEAVWGPPPGETMVYTDEKGARYLVIPRLEYGNVIIAPHPMWGILESEKVVLSKDVVPPHHQYMAFFLWLQKQWGASAWVNLFSNIVLTPGNAQGVLADDHIGRMLGYLPHIHAERLGGNGGPGVRRKAMGALPGWYNIVTPSDMHESMSALGEVLRRYRGASSQAHQEGMEPALRQAVRDAGIDRALEVDVDKAPMPELLQALDVHMARLEKASMPWGGKILGTAPQGEAMAAMVTGMLGRELMQALAPHVPQGVDARELARQLVDDVVNQGQAPGKALQARIKSAPGEVARQLQLAHTHAAALRQAPREVQSIFDLLEGRWVEPGPMGEPFRKPDALPSGRVLYNFDAARVPTIEAEAVGIRQAEAQIEAHRKAHGGEYPKQIAFVLWSAEVAKNNGITEAQILHLLGTRAVRNWRGEVVDVELIPAQELGRPRVDVLVTASGVYRDGYPTKVELIAKAVRLAAASKEKDNQVAQATQRIEASLREAGEAPERARQLALARVYAPAPGVFSSGLGFLARSGDYRGDESRMSDLYTRRMSHAYGGGLQGEYSRKSFEANLARTDGAVLPRSSDVNGMLDHPESAGFLGGLNLAAKSITGRDVDLYVSNLRDAQQPIVEAAAAALQTELRARYFNPKWLAENQAHGYDGARNFMFLTDHLDLWDSTATSLVTSADWAEVKSVFIDDKFKLDMDQFFDQHNPYAHQMLMTNLLGAAQRGHWEATPEELAQVARRLGESVLAHGPACEANQCRNAAMTEFVAKALEGQPDAERLIEGYKAAIEQAQSPQKMAAAGFGLEGAPPPAAEPAAPPPPAPAAAEPAVQQVEGMELARVEEDAPQPHAPSRAWLVWLALAAVTLAGAARQHLRRSA